MEALFIFIAKASCLIAVFYFAYYFLLRKETFFTGNRYFLLAGLLTSVILPFIIYTKVVWVDPVPVSYAPVANYHYASSYTPQIAEEESFEIDWNLVYLAIYVIGFSAFMIKFAIDFYSLNSVLKGKKIKQQEDFKLVDVNENIAPFSYFDYIVYNSSLYSEAELQSILEHEKVHSDQHHTVDVIISRIFCILFWFNPLIWFYKKAILQNLEFIADSEASKKISDKKAYQYTLLKITTHETCVAITNHFYQSLIKKRIVMLNKNQSKKWNYWKYYAIVPALAAFVLLFQIKTIAQEKAATAKTIKESSTSANQDSETFKITKTTTDQELKVIAEKIKQSHGFDVAISNIKRNANKELTGIKINIKRGSQEVQTVQINGDEAIKSFGLVVSTEGNDVKKIGVVTDAETNKSMQLQDRIADAEEVNSPANNDIVPPTPPTPASVGNIVPPVPPVAPVFPAGALPPAPAVDMSKMPKPPVPPKNTMDKVAMQKFEKEMEEFEKKMEKFQPNIDAMSAYGDAVSEIMSKRGAIFEKEMEKYEVAMQKFNFDMDKFNMDMKMKFGPDSQEYENSMKQYQQDMKQHQLEMRQYQLEMKQKEKQMKLREKELKRWERENKKS
ncbi:BlaR1 peptidase M56 [Flavobacterium cutihirudinis]|uniref:BlaR1 peptidase M56 n=1 Tax=Flavobacterium cutihirudinis TaxID=1265740 RepID=A0A3D9G217_9FLAO|nr:M56 family metallopeptidase [Flavobacterium cutihirudinis]RED27234.1 BlaR1 peptidase M56 [Flavobacterium cutihirudinis]